MLLVKNYMQLMLNLIQLDCPVHMIISGSMIQTVRVQKKIYKLVQYKMNNAALLLNVLRCSAKVKAQALELCWFKVGQVSSR